MFPNVSVVLTSGDGSSFASALKERLETEAGGASEVRWSHVVDSLDGLTDVSEQSCFILIHLSLSPPPPLPLSLSLGSLADR